MPVNLDTNQFERRKNGSARLSRWIVVPDNKQLNKSCVTGVAAPSDDTRVALRHLPRIATLRHGKAKLCAYYHFDHSTRLSDESRQGRARLPGRSPLP